MSGRPGPGGYLAAAIVLLVAVATVVVLAVGGVRIIRDSAITPVRDQTIDVADVPLAIWERDSFGPDDGVALTSCTVTPVRGGQQTRLTVARGTVTAGPWTRVASTPGSMPPGRYRLVCSEVSADDLGVGQDPPVLSLVLRFVGALAAGALGVVLTIILVAVTAWRRHRAARAGMPT